MTENQGAVPELNGPQQFLSGSLEVAIDLGILTTSEAVAHYGIKNIVSKVADPVHRAKILEICTGMDAATGATLPAEITGVLLEAAFKTKRTNPDQVCEVATLDGLAYYQTQTDTWALLLKNDWVTRQNQKDRKLAAAMLGFALCYQLLSLRQIVTAVTVTVLVQQMPQAQIIQAVFIGMDSGDVVAVFNHDSIAENVHLVDIMPVFRLLVEEYGWEKKVEQPAAASAEGSSEEMATGHLEGVSQPPQAEPLPPAPGVGPVQAQGQNDEEGPPMPAEGSDVLEDEELDIQVGNGAPASKAKGAPAVPPAPPPIPAAVATSRGASSGVSRVPPPGQSPAIRRVEEALRPHKEQTERSRAEVKRLQKDVDEIGHKLDNSTDGKEIVDLQNQLTKKEVELSSAQETLKLAEAALKAERKKHGLDLGN